MKEELAKKLAARLRDYPPHEEMRVMEVCGTHTTEFFRSGVRGIFPRFLKLVDGPGCPVCVTPTEYLDRAIAIAKQHNAVITTFGDMLKVPSSNGSLMKEAALGLDVRIVYSPMQCIELAEQNPNSEIVFLSVGFETTAPTQAVLVAEAKNRNMKNISILPGNKLTPPAVRALLTAGEARIDGFILPGHVSAIIGLDSWRFIEKDFGMPSVVAGFEPAELLEGTIALMDLISEKKAATLNQYPYIVSDAGNKRAVDIMNGVFEVSGAVWRGIGFIPESGLKMKDEYSDFDASIKFKVDLPEPREPRGCRCGELLRGLIAPVDCPLYGTACTPDDAVGPCMVSSEGPCAAYYKYWSK
jgi:hydrogenase expression/formation protein HypD